MSAPVLAAFDLASRRTGVCVGDGRGLPHADTWEFVQARDDLGLMLDQFHDRLEALLDDGVAAVIYEAPVLVSQRDNLLKLRKLYSLGPHLEWVCRTRGIPCHELTIYDVKYELTGSKQAEKADMVRAARKVGLGLPPGELAEDAADAFGAWLYLLRHSNRALSAEFDRRLWGSRGGLAL